MPPILSIVGRSNTGKTSLVEALIPELNRRGYSVATLKHSKKGFDIDREGKDSWRHQKAGARLTALSSPGSLVLFENVAEEYSIAKIANNYLTAVDLVITEGYKQNEYPKIEMYRASHNTPLLYDNSEELLAVVGDRPDNCTAPFFELARIAALADIIEEKLLMKTTKGLLDN
ncbi:MAG: molybdopterin-guanine dinucleotide biosynthesis protein B [Desulfocapsa sp.]|nr:molybdopterin-guanine dinucleotide biosynthesis protein B [Desulfocapsa sp.]